MQLLRIGRAAGRRAEGGRVRRTALLLAAAALAFAGTAEVAVYASYDGMEERSAERALQLKDEFPGRTTVAHAVDGFDTLGGRQYSVVYIRPESPDSPLPPGLSSWPEPGQAFLSPALRTALTEAGEPRRYGTVVGTIAGAGLAGPGERYAYVNPTDRQYDADKTYEVVGFGSRSPGSSGDWIFVAPRQRLQTALYLLLVPALVLTVVAARMGSAARDRRTALISALGGGWPQRLWLNLGESAAPVLAGALLGTLPAAAVALTGDVTLPWIGYRLSSDDLAHWWPGLAASAAAAAGAVLLLVCLLHRAASRAKARSVRLTARREQMVRWGAMACPLLVFATVWVPGLLDVTRHSQLRSTLYLTGVALVMVTLPCAVAVGAAAAGSALARSVRRNGSAGALVAGRHTAAHPAVTARLVAGVCIALVLISQLQLKNTQYGATAQAAAATLRTVGTRVLVMDLKQDRLTREQLDSALGKLPAGTRTLAVYQDGDPEKGELPTTRLQGSCASLKTLSLRCGTGTHKVSGPVGDTTLNTVLGWVTVGPADAGFTVRQADPLPARLTERTAPESLLLLAPGRSGLDQAAIQQTVRTELPIGSAQVGTFGETWLLGANLSAAHGRWVVFLGVPGVLLIALAAALANLAEFLRLSRSVAPLSVLTGRRRVFWTSAAWSLLAPLLAAVAAGCVAAVWLASPQENPDQGISLSGSLLWGTAAGLAALSLVAWAWGARSAIAQATRWRPYGE
ncbi:hypothetical protein GCM10010365_51230 [Streptomyces poonensis]|uniref:Permease n=1 Tax=Streptomyces poonensis TaxID=68255 RepID=A0A918PXN0_9ACTN|nr:hypothetical protein GCM10010365_51230 [Streptomyces poonensis]GLJ90009.1 hypothetical protein GCM10017589_26100 [Streptomyces poonensis]